MESYLTAEISASAVTHNLSLLRGLLSPATKLCAVVKADCYGHGLDLLLPVIARSADCLAVATPEEAIHLRRLGYERPILTFFSACAYADGPELRKAMDELVVHHVTLTVVSPAEIASVAESAERVGAVAQVHIKVDTGMGRSGALPESVPAMASLIRRQSNVKLTGAYTHFAVADELDKSFTTEQLGHLLGAIEAAGGRKGLTLHAASSAATLDLAQTHQDMVRPGIAMYGYNPSDDILNPLPLRPALRLKGRLMQIKTAPVGSRVGYGLTYTYPRDTRVGLVPIGYGDGYFRSLSNQASMRIRGKDAPIRGRVSMDQISIDLSAIPEAQVGDWVDIISTDPKAPNSVVNLARLADTIPYEITCRLGRRVRKVLVD